MDTYTVTRELTYYKNSDKKEEKTSQVLLEVGQDFKDLYGIAISPFEITWFNTHFAIWQDFLDHSREEFCLITSVDVVWNSTVDIMESILVECDILFHVFFPYDLINANCKISPSVALSRFGFFWGSDAYFISRKTVSDLLVTCQKIYCPLDEQLLDFGINKSIRFICSDTNWIDYDFSTSPSYLSRRSSILDFLSNYSAWTEDELIEVRKILHYISEVATNLDVTIFLHAGTLLGSIRHGGIMAWDDDVDLMVMDVDVKSLIEKIKKDGIYEVMEWTWKKTGQVYYKVWKPGGYKVEGYAYTFPFVDIWWAQEVGNEVQTNDGYTFRKESYFPLKEIQFEGCKFYHPHISTDILNKMYLGWESAIKIFSWSHKYKNHSVKQVTIPIETNSNGHIVGFK